ADLHAAADAERAATPVPVEAPTPPGVDPTAIARRADGTPGAALSYADAVARVVAQVPNPIPRLERIEPGPDAAAAARGHYERGEAATEAGQHLVAATAFLKALELDPTNPDIVRAVARSYLANGNRVQANRFYEQLAGLAPDDDEALLAVAMSAANRRDFDTAAAVLASASAQGIAFDHDPGAPAIADHTFSLALRQLGYEAAAIEAATRLWRDLDAVHEPSAYQRYLGSIARQRGEIEREMGDACCRLGDYAAAAERYAAAAALPLADPAALTPRRAYALLRSGRPAAARWVVYDAMTSGARPVGDLDIRLCAYLAAHDPDPTLFRAAVRAASLAHPDDPVLVRASAALLPRDEATATLRAFVERRPDDLDAMSQLLAWLIERDERAAIELTVDLATSHPDRAGAYAARLAQAAPDPYLVAETIRVLPPSPGATMVRVDLLTALEAPGAAWQASRRGVDAWPQHVALARQRVDLAAALAERELVEDAIAAYERLNPPDAVLVAGRARRLAGDAARAFADLDAAHRADPADREIALELARVAIDLARGLEATSEIDAMVEIAVDLARRAIEQGPIDEDPFELLLLIAGQDGVRPDRRTDQELRQALRVMLPDSGLLDRLDAQDLIEQRRYEAALERLLRIYEANPADGTSLAIAVSAWLALDRADVAEHWVGERLEHRPGDPALLEQWVRLQLIAERPDAAAARLSAILDRRPDDMVAMRLIESVVRTQGDDARATRLALNRLERQPECIRRELQAATLLTNAGEVDDALRRVGWLADRAADLTLPEIIACLRLLERMETDGARHDELALAFVDAAQAFERVPTAVPARGLSALARLEPGGARYGVMLERLMRSAFERASVSEEAEQLEWFRLAQQFHNAGQTDIAALLLRGRLEDRRPLRRDIRSAMVAATLALDAAHRDGAGSSIDLIRHLDANGRLREVAFLGSSPSPATAFFELSRTYSLYGNDDGAATLLRAAIEAEPDMGMALNNLGYQQIESGPASAEAIALVERAAALLPDDPNILDTLGWLRYRQGRFEDVGGVAGARSLIERAMAGPDPASSEVLDHYGDVLWRLGRHDAAIEAWSEAVRRHAIQYPSGDMVRGLGDYQLRQFGLLVDDPQAMYHRLYGRLLDRLEQKLSEARLGLDPAVAPTFDEAATRSD
ncbi:MAG: hypothetical protein KDA25_07870, partial [Phycisphaerales bacterium]|nr:hypothetical protein [Phycisphaerales bacterium]